MCTETKDVNYYLKLYNDKFGNYKKDLGPWTLSNNEDDRYAIDVEFSAQLMSIDRLVSGNAF